MALALKKKSDDGDTASEPKHSLRKRFHAWWEGYELGPPVAGDGASADAGGAANDAAAGDGSDSAGAEEEVWSESRKKLAEIVWGEGFTAPGGSERVVDLAQPFGLTSENTMLEIGSGPGGGACAIAEKVGSYVDGFDLNDEMAKQALAISMMRDLDSKAKVKAFDPATFELKKNFYEGCLLRETLIAIEDKEALLDVVTAAIKPGKPLVIAEMFTVTPEPAELAAAALSREFGDAYPCDVDRIVTKLEASNFEVRVNNDETESYTEMARNAWGDVAKRISDQDLEEELAGALLRETELWELRIAAFETDELKMQRIVAFKKSAEIT